MPSSPSHQTTGPVARRADAIRFGAPEPVAKEAEARVWAATAFEIGMCVRVRRHRLKLGQADLAARVGVRRQRIIALESGKGSVELALVLETLKVLDIDLMLLVREPPDWSIALAASAGTRARPYGKPRYWRVRPQVPEA